MQLTLASFSEIIDENGNVGKDYGESCIIYFEKLSKELDEKDLLPEPHKHLTIAINWHAPQQKLQKMRLCQNHEK